MFYISTSTSPLIICYSAQRSLVIQGLLAGYDAKPIGAGLVMTKGQNPREIGQPADQTRFDPLRLDGP